MSSASTGGAPAQRAQSLKWSKAGNVYMRFNEADAADGGSGMAEWLRLKIVTREKKFRVESEAQVCSVCLEARSKPQKSGGHEHKGSWRKSSCAHFTHSKCLEAWKALERLQGRDSACPICRHAHT